MGGRGQGIAVVTGEIPDTAGISTTSAGEHRGNPADIAAVARDTPMRHEHSTRLLPGLRWGSPRAHVST